MRNSWGVSSYFSQTPTSSRVRPSCTSPDGPSRELSPRPGIVPAGRSPDLRKVRGSPPQLLQNLVKKFFISSHTPAPCSAEMAGSRQIEAFAKASNQSAEVLGFGNDRLWFSANRFFFSRTAWLSPAGNRPHADHPAGMTHQHSTSIPSSAGRPLPASSAVPAPNRFVQTRACR